MHVLFQGDSHEDGTSGLARRCFGRKRIDATETSVDVKGDGRGRRVGHEHDETATTTAATARRTGGGVWQAVTAQDEKEPGMRKKGGTTAPEDARASCRWRTCLWARPATEALWNQKTHTTERCPNVSCSPHRRLSLCLFLS
ncbi:hypothetical protein TW95_gp1094 [Pandoravirus inopinatum]|uniref:Uncharacterized protein n=1 Tax=Pandoravirus inopinatum TaxID=1605721 RepID=A0A0B5IYA3_9VIRU|nr:hypothetical protein TW95_gp1094 [Pandoravirus inopinatum]AJF97828.1 hypothetical protein [Pandoravirus inopinatum]